VNIISIPNSEIICLQGPQGAAGCSASVTTMQWSNFTFLPSEAIAEHRAPLSAHIPEGYAAFSTLHP